jgi:hypothetical protein
VQPILQLLLDSIAQALERKHLYVGYPGRHRRKACISHTQNFQTQRVRIPALVSHFNGLSLFGMGASFVSEMVIPYFQSAGQIAM